MHLNPVEPAIRWCGERLGRSDQEAERDFFAGFAPGGRRTHGCASFELPIRYYREDSFALYFAANPAKVRARMPCDALHPVTLPDGRALVAFAAFNYLETSVGPYGEIAVAVPVVHAKRPPPPLLPLLLEARWPHFGALVLHLPVTGTLPRDAGRGEWGYPKFVADMRFDLGSDLRSVWLGEDGRHILTLRVARAGLRLREARPLRTFTTLGSRLLETSIPQRGRFRLGRPGPGSGLALGGHPVADDIRALGIEEKPLLSRWYEQRVATLPAGRAVAVGERPVDGYRGSDREGELEVLRRGTGR